MFVSFRASVCSVIAWPLPMRDRRLSNEEAVDTGMAHIKNLVKKLLRIEETPERTALAYAIGIFLGFSPFLGFHTLLA